MPKSAMKGLQILAATLLILAGSAVAAILVYRAELAKKVTPSALPQSPLARQAAAFPVHPGQSVGEVADSLTRWGWIPSAWPFRLASRLEGWDRRLVPGWYAVRPGETVSGLLRRLRQGEIEEVQVTIPEGWRRERILAVLADSVWISLDSLRAAAVDSAFLASQEVPGPGLEGYLFPETYRIPRGQDPRRLLEQLLAPGRDLWRDTLQVVAESLGFDRNEVWTLASVVEAEAADSSERARISAVFWNRLRRGMRLESDPTVHYALQRPPGRLLYRDLEVDSPYNTYRYAGLPPGPIGSPGRASLWAALHPLPGCEDLYFVARGDGSHVFSRTLAEHNRAKARIRRQGSVSGGRSSRSGAGTAP